MRVLILGIGKRDCEEFAARFGFEEFEWASPRSSARVRGLTVDVIYATDALEADREAYDELCREAAPARLPGRSI